MSATFPSGRSWFKRGRHRQLSDLEQGFLSALITMLNELSPAQVDPAQTALTHEGDSFLICLIPHRCLGGLTIDIGISTNVRISVSWADVFNLSYHDDLDMGHVIDSHEIGDLSAPDFGPAVQCVREQLTRPLTMRTWRGRDDSHVYAECFLSSGPRIAQIGKRPWRAIELKEGVVFRFVDTAPPPFTYPSYAPVWFESESTARKRLKEIDRK